RHGAGHCHLAWFCAAAWPDFAPPLTHIPHHGIIFLYFRIPGLGSVTLASFILCEGKRLDIPDCGKSRILSYAQKENTVKQRQPQVASQVIDDP
ncbi:hypothetical protein NYR54_18685, partial [Chelativorans sp. SCAU2101]